MTRPLTLALIAIGSAAIALPSAVVATYDRHAAHLVQLQSLAETSCKCARRSGSASGKAECWRPFDRAVAPDLDPNEETATACAPLSTRMVCLRSGECVVKSYDIIVRGGEGAFCTQAEAMTAEKAFDDQPGIETPQGTLVSFDMLFVLSRAYAKDDRVAQVRSQGCAGGAAP